MDPCPSGQQRPKLEGAETGFLPYKKSIFLLLWKAAKANWHSALPVKPRWACLGKAVSSLQPRHHRAVAMANPGSHIVTSFLAPLGQDQPSVLEPQQPLDSIDHTLTHCGDRLCKSFAQTAETRSIRETRPGEDRLYHGKHSQARSCVCLVKAWKTEE